jgi:hypothetical protein
VRAYFAEVTAGSPVPVLALHSTFTRENVFGYITGPDVRYEARVRLRVPTTRRFRICNGDLLLSDTLVGADGSCMGLGPVAPTLCRAIVDAGYRDPAVRGHRSLRRGGGADRVDPPRLRRRADPDPGVPPGSGADGDDPRGAPGRRTPMIDV